MSEFDEFKSEMARSELPSAIGFKKFIDENTLEASGYIQATEDLMAELAKRLENYQSFDEAKTDLVELLRNRKTFCEDGYKLFP